MDRSPSPVHVAHTAAGALVTNTNSVAKQLDESTIATSQVRITRRTRNIAEANDKYDAENPTGVSTTVQELPNRIQ